MMDFEWWIEDDVECWVLNVGLGRVLNFECWILDSEFRIGYSGFALWVAEMG